MLQIATNPHEMEYTKMFSEKSSFLYTIRENKNFPEKVLNKKYKTRNSNIMLDKVLTN